MNSPAILLCIVLLACSVSAMASGDEPSDHSSDSAVAIDFREPSILNLGLFSQESAAGQDAPLPEIEEDAEAAEGEGGAAGSNPLASVNKLDLIWALTASGGANTHDVHAEGAFMLDAKLKLNYEVHYFFTDVTGSSENNWESIRLRLIWVPADVELNDDWTMRVAVGAEYIHSFDNVDQGIGADSDIAAPLFGLAFAKPEEREQRHDHRHREEASELPPLATSAFATLVKVLRPGGRRQPRPVHTSPAAVDNIVSGVLTPVRRRAYLLPHSVNQFIGVANA